MQHLFKNLERSCIICRSGTSDLLHIPIVQSFVSQVTSTVVRHHMAIKNLASAFQNITRYYSQFLSTIDTAIADGLRPIEKDLHDFVELSKWQDKGFYSRRSVVERAQRRLHKLSRRFVCFFNLYSIFCKLKFLLLQ